MLAGAGVGAHLMLAFGSLALMFGLGHWMALGWAALIVAVLWAAVAAALASSGRKAIKNVSPALPQTTDTLKEDAQWAKRPRG
jgi:membrane protein implicated in regulation of membrane protease activity